MRDGIRSAQARNRVALASPLALFMVLLASLLPAEEPGERTPHNTLRLRLPDTIYAVPGVETNVYFDNICLVLNPANYLFDVTCGKGKQQAERWTYTPKPEDVGVHAFRIEVRNNENRIVAQATSRIRVTSAEAGVGRAVSCLIIGDSLTAASVYPQRLLDHCAEAGNPVLKLIGSYGPGGKPGRNRHEGYSGWTAARFATHFTGTPREGERENRATPFMYLDAAGKPDLDFARYCRDMNDGTAPETQRGTSTRKTGGHTSSSLSSKPMKAAHMSL